MSFVPDDNTKCKKRKLEHLISEANCSDHTDAVSLLEIVKTNFKRCSSKTVSDDVCQLLADHCLGKLSEIIESAIDYMNCRGKRTFSCGDFNKGLFFCGELKLDKQAGLLLFPREGMGAKLAPQTLRVNEKWLNYDRSFCINLATLPDGLRKCFNLVTRVLLREKEEVCCSVLKEISTNKCFFHLSPYFINFLCDSIIKYGNDFLRISVLLKSIKSLFLNPHVFFRENGYLNMLANALLNFLLAPLPYLKRNNDCWLLKDTSASLLAFIVNQCKSKELFLEALKHITSVLSNFNSSLFSHYGALAALNSIGVPAILILLPSCIEKYYKFINLIYASNYRNRHDICMIQGQLINAHYLLVHHYFKYEFRRSYDFNLQYRLCSHFYLPDFLRNNKVLPILKELNFYDYFGDSLVQDFPLLNFASSGVCSRKKEETKPVKLRKLKKLSSTKSNQTKYVQYSTNEVFDVVPIKNHKISFGKINNKLILRK